MDSIHEDKKKKNATVWGQEALVFFSSVTGWIVGPVVFSLWFGTTLDKKYGTAPRYLIILVIFAFIVTTVGLLKEVQLFKKRVIKAKLEIKNKKQISDSVEKK